jgi:hypothetical protein
VAVVRQDLLLLLVFGFLVGLFNLEDKQYELSVLCMGLASTLAGVRFFSTERVVFWRECSSGLSIPAYYMGKTIAVLPLTVMYPLAYLSFYYLMSFPKVMFDFYYVILLWAGWVCFGVGVIMSLVFEPKNAQIAGVVVALVGFLFGGHNPDAATLQQTVVGRIGMWLSYVRWSIGALLIKDAGLYPPCNCWWVVHPLASEGFVPMALMEVPPQSFQSSTLDPQISHARQMLIILCVLYQACAMVFMWISGKWRARMMDWDYMTASFRQYRLSLRQRLLLWLNRLEEGGWCPTCCVDAVLVMGRAYAAVPDQNDDDIGDYDGNMSARGSDPLLPHGDARREQQPEWRIHVASEGGSAAPVPSPSVGLGGGRGNQVEEAM